MFYKDERLALFIDGAALHRAADALGFRIDFQKLQKEFQRRGKLAALQYYAAIGDRGEYAGIHKLHDWLSYHGFRLVTKPLKEYVNADGLRKVKANINVELTVDALELARVGRVDHVVIFSGNEELVPLVEGIQRLGTRVSIISTRETEPRMIADELRRAADEFIELEQLREVIEQNREVE